MPTVSVIIPVFNKAQFLVCCIESVLSQTYKDFELILIDDGSTDESLSICQKYAEFNSSVKVYHQENAGASAARNYGIDIAQGKWCSFIDADDLWDEKKLERTLEYMKANSKVKYLYPLAKLKTAGLMAAGTAAENGADVLLIDKNERVGRKLMITGKGRCNVTNNCKELNELISNVPVNGKFLYSAFSNFMPLYIVGTL